MAQDETTTTCIAPEGADRYRPYTEDATLDAEGHAPRFRPYTETDEPGIQPEGANRGRPLTEEPDTEGHMPFRRGATEPGPDEPGAEDAEGHAAKFRPYTETDEPGMQPEGSMKYRPLTEDDDAAGIGGGGEVRVGYRTSGVRDGGFHVEHT